MGIIIDNTDHEEAMIYDPGTDEIEAVVKAGTAVLMRTSSFEPRLVVADDAIYVAHDDGFIRKWTLVGEIEEAFDPIPISGSDEDQGDQP